MQWPDYTYNNAIFIFFFKQTDVSTHFTITCYDHAKEITSLNTITCSKIALLLQTEL